MKIRNPGNVFTSLLNYAAAVGLSVLFALYLKGRVGWFITAAFICAPVLSALIAVLLAPRISVSCENDFHALCKGESCFLTLTVANNCFLPSPPVIIDSADCPRARCSGKSCVVSVMPFSEEIVSFGYNARICGPAEIGVMKIAVSDYFGIFEFVPKGIKLESLSVTIPIIPDIAGMTGNDPVIRSSLIAAEQSDDSEETTDSGINTFGGFPGYDIREYFPGDPLKRINWKQSAKKGKLFVRLDDERFCPTVTVVLDNTFISSEIFPPAFLGLGDFSGYSAEDVEYVLAQCAVETSLGAAAALITAGCNVSFMLYGRGGWMKYPAADETDISYLRTELSSYSFCGKSGLLRLPLEELLQQKGSAVIFCTPYLDEELARQTAPYTGGGKGALSVILYPAAVSPRATVKEAAVND